MLNHLKTIFFLLLCLAVGVGLGKGYIWFTHPRPPSADFTNSLAAPVITGVGDAPAHRGFTLDPASLPALASVLQQSQEVFATTVALEYGPSLTPAALGAAVKSAHQKHMFVALLPPPTFTLGNPYPRPLPDIAAEAQSAGVDLLCISWLNTESDSGYWRQQCQALRPLYQGQIILAATPAILPTLSCLDAPDLIGAIGPIPLPRRLPNSSEDVTVHDLRVAWDCAITSIESLARANSKKIALLHMNIPVEVSARLPAPGTPDHPAANPALQKMLYEALLLETKGRSTWTDVLLFNYQPGQVEGPNTIPGLLAKVTDAWDPKKPAPEVPALQADLQDLPDLPEVNLDNPETSPDTSGVSKPN